MDREGDGASPDANDRVTVHYHGTLIDGTVFDSSYDRGQPATFGLNQVISGWTEGLQTMKKGGQTTLFIPSNLVYGPRATGDVIGANSTLVFKVELLEVEAVDCFFFGHDPKGGSGATSSSALFIAPSNQDYIWNYIRHAIR